MSGGNHQRSVRNVRAEILARFPCPVIVLLLIAVPGPLGRCRSRAATGVLWLRRVSLSPRPEGWTPAPW